MPALPTLWIDSSNTLYLNVKGLLKILVRMNGSELFIHSILYLNVVLVQ
jgi:hypothetical protein